MSTRQPLTSLLSMSVFAVVVLLVITTVAGADLYVRGYYRSNGTYVQPHYRSNPDGNPYNNWSTYPNINPYTGKRGTKRLSTMGNLNITPSYRKPGTLPSYSPGIPGHSFWRSKPTPLPTPLPRPTYPLGGFGRSSVLSY